MKVEEKSCLCAFENREKLPQMIDFSRIYVILKILILNFDMSLRVCMG